MNGYIDALSNAHLSFFFAVLSSYYADYGERGRGRRHFILCLLLLREALFIFFSFFGRKKKLRLPCEPLFQLSPSPPHAQRPLQDLVRHCRAPSEGVFRTPATTGQSLSCLQQEGNSRKNLFRVKLHCGGAFLLFRALSLDRRPLPSRIVTSFAPLGALDSASRGTLAPPRWLTLSNTLSCREGMTPCAPLTGETHAAKTSSDTSIS
jgi:hypothetical protein